ncbi:MAG TPA: right-handed parallel beta-helix repeat-containing protein [Terracidiphilus sp.]|nr:right-handed parallel beta-helix repeat-containing protein [Terracidiphilus sp.]
MMGRVKVPSSSRLWLSVICLAAFGLSGVRAWGATFTVTDTSDSASDTGSLRYAIAQAQANPGSTINFAPGVTGTITLVNGQLAISGNTTIIGPGANQLTISGGNASRIFSVNPTTVVASISGLTLANGNASPTNSPGSPGTLGGDIYNAGTLTVANCAFSSSATGTFSGGAIYNGGTLIVTGSTFSGVSGGVGGAINSGGTLTVTNSTFTGNSGGTGGAIYVNNGPTVLTNNTFLGNVASSQGGAIDSGASSGLTVTVTNNIFSGNTSLASNGAGVFDANGTVTADHNVYFNNLGGGSEDDCHSCSSNTNSTSATSSPLTLPLGYYGGQTQTYLPQPGSKAICAGSLAGAANLTADQRGFALNPSYNPCTTGSVDAGAVQANYIQVQSSGDAGAGASDCPSTSCTLRDAILLANGNGYGDIDVASSVSSITLAGANGTLNLTGASGINIIGSGANSLTVNGGGSTSNFSVFTVGSGAQVLMNWLTIANGTTSANGGGINNSGNLSATGLAVTSNSAVNGGGIYNTGTLTLLDSTLSGNTAANGGGIDNNSGTLQLTESTLSGNTVVSSGGAGLGAGLYAAGGTVTVVNTTIAGNSASGTPKANGGGIDAASSATVNVANSIVSGNTANGTGSNTNGTSISTSSGGNVIGGTVTLSSLGLYGPNATVQTLVPVPGGTNGNPAICAGKSSNLLTGITTDERGQPNTNTTYSGYSAGSPCVDAGAVQTNYSMSFSANPPASVTVDEGFGAGVTLDESTQPFAGVSIPLTVSSGTLSGTTTVATDGTGVATYSGLSATLGTGFTLNASLSLNAALTSPLSLSAASSPFDVTTAPTQVGLQATPTSSTVNQSVTLTATISPNVTNLVGASSVVPMTGSVAFSVGGQAITCGSGSAAFAFSSTTGTATQTCVTSALPGGNPDSITAVYTSGDSNYQASPASAPLTVVVTPATTTTSIKLTTGSNPSTVNDTLTFTATVSATGQVVTFSNSDTVTFSDGTSQLTCGAGSSNFNPSTGVATCVVNTLNASSTAQSIKAAFSGDASYAASSGTVSHTVNQASTSVTLQSDASNPSNPPVGSSLIFDATVSTPGTQVVAFSTSGTVAFTDGTTGVVLCPKAPITVTAGVATATCTTTGLSLGSNNVTASYNGDTNYSVSPASNTVTLTLVTAPTHSLIGSPTSASINQTVTFTETVKAPAANQPKPTGTVTFSSSSTGTSGPFTNLSCGSSGTVTIPTNGLATCQASFATSGQYTIEATYSGDSNYAAFSAPDVFVEQVGTTPTNTKITAPGPGATSTVNASVSISASVTPTVTGGPPLKGNVTITDNGNVVCTGPINSTSNTYSCTTQALTLNSNSLVASFNLDGSDSNYASSTSPAASVSVSQGSSSVQLSSSANPSTVNTTVTFTAAVTVPSGPAGLSGTVTFTALNTTTNTTSTLCSNAAINLATGSTSSGTATCPTTFSVVDPYTITATYSGNTDFQGNNTSASQTVAQAATITAFVSAPATLTVDQGVNFQVLVTGPAGTTSYAGTVAITDNGTTICSGLTVAANGTVQPCPDNGITAGLHQVTAKYENDQVLGASSASVSLQVSPATTALAVTSSSNPSVVQNANNVNDTVTFTAAITTTPATAYVPLTGTVSFTANGIVLCGAVTVTNGQAACVTTSLPGGSYAIQAGFSNDPNYTVSSAQMSMAQVVQDYSLLASAPSVELSPGYTNLTDLFTPQTISVTPVSTQGFATTSGNSLALSCTVAPVFSSSSSPTAPKCTLTPATLAVLSTGAQPGASVVIDATNASAGLYSAQVSGTDPITGLVRTSTIQVTVRPASTPLTVVSGATTNNTGNISFLLPAGVSLSNLSCASVSGPNLSSSVSPSSLKITCAFNPTSIAASGSAQVGQTTVTVGTGGSGTNTAAVTGRQTNLWLAGLLGLPLFGLMGMIRGRKSRDSVFFRLLVVAVICVVAFQAIGCGGSFNSSLKSGTQGTVTTPPGVYNVLVVGSGSDGGTYRAVLQLNVQL